MSDLVRADYGGGMRRTSFQDELDRLEANLQEESELVLRSLRGSLNALEQQDSELADEVIAFDDEVDARYLEISQSRAALGPPDAVADDLRLVLAVLHINLGLERMADLCVTIAKLTKLTADLPPGRDARRGLRGDGSAGRGDDARRNALVRRARDVEGAESLVDLDELIDRANRRVVEHVLELGNDLALREWGLRMIVVSGAWSGSATAPSSIGEQTAYLVTGEFREFTDASHPESS